MKNQPDYDLRPHPGVHRIWIEQCAATEGLRARFGLKTALEYLVGEKLFRFVKVSERDPLCAAALPAFLAEILRIFSVAEIAEYLRPINLRHLLVGRSRDQWKADKVRLDRIRQLLSASARSGNTTVGNDRRTKPG